jgi:murein DD-endopeptidase MepM/ murein hydrolase activator NlpD
MLALALSMAAAATDNAGAAQLYTYKSEDGGLTFTDKMDSSKEPIEVEQLEAYEPKNRVTIDKIGEDANFKLTAYNEYYGPVEVRIDLQQSANMSSNHDFPYAVVVKSRGKRELIRMWVTDTSKGGSYTYTTTVVIGDPAARHNDNILYGLPVAVKDAGRVFISQGFNGQGTHGDVQSRYAIDIPVAEGTNVRAARAGMVMDVANDYFRGGKASKLLDRANFVRVLHDDGTMALYAHLQLESIQVRMGERVQPGQVIAKAGNTGYSSGPHLHFVVQKNFGGELRAVPFRLMGANGVGVVPETGMTFP